MSAGVHALRAPSLKKQNKETHFQTPLSSEARTVGAGAHDPGAREPCLGSPGLKELLSFLRQAPWGQRDTPSSPRSVDTHCCCPRDGSPPRSS